MPLDNMEQQLDALTRELKRIGDEVNQTAESAIREAKSSGQMATETKAAADQLLAQQGDLSQKVTALTERLDAGERQTLDLEQKLAGRRDGDRAAVRQTLGAALAADQSVKSFGGKGTVKVEVRNAITTASGSGGDLSAPARDPDVVGLPMQERRIRDLLPVVPIERSSVEYVRQTTRTNAAAPVAEEALKPESVLEWELLDAVVKTIATWIPVSKQAMDDLPMLQGLIDTELRYMIDIVEDAQILAGDGTGQNLSGLITNATAYSGAGEASITNPTLIDKIRVGLLEASLNLFPADGIILHPSDWMAAETTKDAQNRYIFANPQGISGPVLWGRPVVATQAMPIDKFLVGAFRVAATLYDRMTTEVVISSEDRDNFVKNMLTVLAEKRLALAVKRPESLIYGDLGLVA